MEYSKNKIRHPVRNHSRLLLTQRKNVSLLLRFTVWHIIRIDENVKRKIHRRSNNINNKIEIYHEH